MLGRLSRHGQSFRRLSWPERRWLMQGLLLLPLAAVALRWLGLRRLQGVLSRPMPPPGGRLESAERTQALSMARILGIAARCGFYRATCLHRSLVLWWWLRRLGVESELRIGVRRDSGRFEAHAWIECQGLVLDDTVDIHQHFAAFDADLLKAEMHAL